MTTALQLRRGTTAQHSTFTGANGEVTVDTDKKTVVVHDGVTPGGTALAKEADAANKVRFDISTQNLNATQQTNARTNIGAAKDPGANGWIVRTGSGTTVNRTLVAGSGISISNVDGVNGDPVITNTGVRSVNGQTGDVTVAVNTSDKVAKAGDTMTGKLYITGGGTQGNSGMATASGSLGQIEVQGNGTGAAVIAFHRPGSYAAYLGLDTDNQWKVGGWSAGAAAYTIWHSGNFNATNHGVHLTSGVIAAGWKGWSSATSNGAWSNICGIYTDTYGRVTSVVTNCNCTCC